MKPLHIVVVLVSLAVGIAVFMPPKSPQDPPPPDRRLGQQANAKTRRTKRKKKKRVALRIRRRGRTVRMKRYTSDGPFLFYKPKSKSKQLWKVGTKLRYRIWYKATSTLRLSLLPQHKGKGIRRVRKRKKRVQKGVHLITGELHMHVKHGNKGVAHVAAQLSKLAVKDDKRTAPSTREMQGVFWFQIGTDGRFARFRFPQGTTKKQNRMIKELVKQLEFRLPATYKGNKWTYQEPDSNGTYSETVQWLKRTQYAKQTIDFFMKKKERYNKLRKQKFVAAIKLDKSLYRIKLDTSEYGLESIDGGETIAFQRSGGITWMKATFAIAYQRIHDADETLALWSARRGKSARIPRPRRRRLRRRAASKYTSLTAAMQAFRNLRSKSKRNAAQAVAGFLRDNPGQNQVLADMIKQKSVPAKDHSLLIHTFELAATPAAQSTLVNMMNDKGHTDANRLRAIVASNSFKSPSKQVVDSLWGLHRKGAAQNATSADKGRASTALLALGALSKINASQARQITGQLNEKLTQALQQARTDTQRRTALIAIQNAASDSLGPTIKPYLEHTTYLVRRAAVEAFSGMSPNPHNRWLAARLLREPIAGIQADILTVIAKKQQPVPTVTNWVKANLHRRKNQQLRSAMVHYLGRTQKSMPLHKQLLAVMVKGESNPHMIRTIYKYIMQK